MIIIQNPPVSIIILAHRSDARAIISEHKSKGYRCAYKRYVGNHLFKMKFVKSSPVTTSDVPGNITDTNQ